MMRASSRGESRRSRGALTGVVTREPPDGRYDASCGPQAEPHGGQQNQHRHDYIERCKSELEFRAVLRQALIFRNRVMGLTLTFEHYGVDIAQAQQIGVDEGVQLHQSGDDILLRIGTHHDLTRIGLRDLIGAGRRRFGKNLGDVLLLRARLARDDGQRIALLDFIRNAFLREFLGDRPDLRRLALCQRIDRGEASPVRGRNRAGPLRRHARPRAAPA